MLSRIPTTILCLFAAICFSTMTLASSLGEEGMVTDRKLNLVWVADASHAQSSGFGNPVFSSAGEAQEFVTAMNEGRLENFGRSDWRLASEFELGRLYQAYMAGSAPPAFRNFEVFRNWFESSKRGVRGSWGARGHRSGGGVYGWPVRAAQSAPPGFEDVAVFGSNSILINRSTMVTGNAVANNALSGPTLDPGFTASLQRNTSVSGDVKGDTVVLNNGSSVGGTVFYNQLTDFGAVPPLNTSTPLPLPVFDELPVFQPADVGTGNNVTVDPGATVTLAPGRYDQVAIDKTGTLVLDGGQYDFGAVVAIGTIGGQCAFPCRSMLFAGPSDVRVAGRFDIGADGRVAPQTMSGITAANVILYVGGLNGGDGTPTAVPPAFNAGQGSTVQANVYAPNGSIVINQDSTVDGGLFGRDVNIERDSTVTLNSFYANQPPTADPQDVFTSAPDENSVADPIEIILTGSDPEGLDLSFSIEPSGPTQGTLSSVTPIIPDPVGRCSLSGESCGETADCPEMMDVCEDFQQPPVTSASVTYTPTVAGDPEDGFTFTVADPEGATGMAAVRINPPGDVTVVPPLAAVEACPAELVTDPETGDLVLGPPGCFVETQIDTPVDINLNAGAPAGDTLAFSIESLPANGTLSEGGTAIETVPFALSGSAVTYTPGSMFQGQDEFDFKAEGTPSATSDIGTVFIDVVPLFELAPDQMVTTPPAKPILVTLIGNPGGTGVPTPPQARTIRLAARGPGNGPSYAIIPTGAAIAGNVTDSDGDGFGDGRDDLPGPAPVLIAAGVDVNLGSTDLYDNAADFQTALGGASTLVEDFDSLAVGTNLKGVEILTGVTTDTNMANLQVFSGQVMFGFDSSTRVAGNAFYELTLTSDYNAVSFTIESWDPATPGPVTVEITLRNGSVEVVELTKTTGSESDPVFFGVISNFFIDKIVLREGPEVGGSGNEEVALDNITVADSGGSSVVGVARIQIEWDISALGLTSDEVESADVVLNTEKGSVDSLDTFFFSGDDEQDGILAVTDFEAPATQLNGVVMPVPAGSQTGDQGTFSFFVTNALKAAIDNGLDFFSIQGRVDESLAGQGFQRGLQIRSTATGNLTAGLEPLLNVDTGELAEPVLLWTLTKAPEDGTLRDLSGNLVVEGQTFTSAPTLVYTADTGFEGTNTIEYTVEQSGLIDTGIITVVVTSVGSCQDNEAFCDDGRTSP